MNRTEVNKLISKYHVPANVLEHMVKVTALALYLGRKLKERGNRINLILIRQAGLLHDILKICDFKNLDHAGLNRNTNKADIKAWVKIRKQYAHLDHVTAGHMLLKSLGEGKIAEMIKKHRFSCVINEEIEERPQTWEEKILYYADKRVMHDKIVSIRERLDDLNKRYGHGNLTQKTVDNIKAILSLEKEICRAAGLEAHQIEDKLITTGREYVSLKEYIN